MFAFTRAGRKRKEALAEVVAIMAEQQGLEPRDIRQSNIRGGTDYVREICRLRESGSRYALRTALSLYSRPNDLSLYWSDGDFTSGMILFLPRDKAEAARPPGNNVFRLGGIDDLNKVPGLEKRYETLKKEYEKAEDDICEQVRKGSVDDIRDILKSLGYDGYKQPLSKCPEFVKCPVCGGDEKRRATCGKCEGRGELGIRRRTLDIFSKNRGIGTQIPSVLIEPLPAADLYLIIE